MLARQSVFHSFVCFPCIQIQLFTVVGWQFGVFVSVGLFEELVTDDLFVFKKNINVVYDGLGL